MCSILERQVLSFVDREYDGKPKRTRREVFLAEIPGTVPWVWLEALIEPHCPKGGGGRRRYALATMLRIHCLQQWYGLKARFQAQGCCCVTAYRPK